MSLPSSVARLHLESSHVLHAVDPRLYGSFVEHLGRCVYTGIFEPGHPTADAAGFRQDVAGLIRELSPTVLRYPGGNFVSTYRWEDGVGPVEKRPVRLDPAWRTTEPNTIGTNEFIAWCRTVGCDPMLAFNLGTRGVAEALDYWEYCNHPGGTALSGLRKSHGHPEPHHVRLWCLGNEMDGPWQMGHKTAAEYGRLACETARALKQCDPSLELVVAGSCSSGLPSYPEWDRIVLEHTYEFIDHLSLHLYVNDHELSGLPAYLAVGLRMDAMIRTISATCDYVKALKRSKKDIHLAFDEWNVWHWKNLNAPGFTPWSHAPAQVEQIYTAAEAVIFGSLILSLLRHADRVRIANLAQLVNVIAPIMTVPGGPAWRQTIFYPFQDFSRHSRGEVVFTRVESPVYSTGEFGDVPYVEAVAVRALDSGALTVFAINRHLTDALPLVITDDSLRLREHRVLTHADPRATNTAEHPDRVVPRPATQPGVLPPLSWNILHLLPATLRAFLVAAAFPLFSMQAQPRPIEIDATTVLRTFVQNPIGININHLMDADEKRPAGTRPLAAALAEMGVASLRFPEGELGDSYLWAAAPFPVASAARPQWALRGPDLWPANDPRFSTPDFQPRPEIMGFDVFLDLATATRTRPVIIVAYDSAYKKISDGHTRPTVPELITSAAAWVRYANVARGQDIRYWEIGNETDIRPEAHSGADPGARQYAEDVVAFSRAMKAEDPSIKIGLNVWKNDRLAELLAIPDLWPHVDFVSLHNYPNYGWAKGYETFRSTRPNFTHSLQEAERLLQNSVLPADTKTRLEFLVTETNAIDWAGTDGWPNVSDHGHALVLFDIIGQTLLQPRVTHLQHWVTRWIHNDETHRPLRVYDALTPESRFTPLGHAVRLWARHLGPCLVAASGAEGIHAYASTDPAQNRLAVFLVNKEHHAQRICLRLRGVTAPRLESIVSLSASAPESPTSTLTAPPASSASLDDAELLPLSITVLQFVNAPR